MKIDGCDIEFKFEEDEYSDDVVTKYYVLQFVCAPRGRQKVLLTIIEQFKGVILEHVDMGLDGARTAKERSKLISSLLRGSFRSQTKLDPLTKQILKAPYIKKVNTFFARFEI